MLSPRVPGVAVALVLALVAPRGTHAWQTLLPDSPPASRPFAVTVDGEGDVLTVGRVVIAPGDDDALIAKLSGADGALRWRHTFAGSAVASDLLRSVATDSLQGVVAGGQLRNLTTGGDLLITKHDASGAQVWRIELDGGAGGEDDALAVSVDAAGAPIVAAQLTPAGASTTRFAVLKLQALDGATLWRTDLPGGSGSARAVVADGDDVIAAGDAGGLVVVAKLAAATGTQLWRTDVAGSAGGAHVGRALAVGSGRVVVAGRMRRAVAGGPDFGVVALDAATGAEVWRHLIDGTAGGTADNDDAFGVGIDAMGDVVAAGRLTNAGTDDDAVVVKLAGASGRELWRVTLNGGNGNDDVAQAVALGTGGDVFVVGTIRNPGTRADLLLARLAGVSGEETWRRSLDGGTNGADAGFAAHAAGGHLVGAARLRSGDAADAFAVVKLTGANGGDFPCADGTRDTGEGCDDGNVTAGDGCRADCTVEACGDGIRDPQEACDDGGLAAGDCCSATCTAEADGNPCDDADACTASRCAEGVCTVVGVVICAPLHSCDEATCDPGDGSCTHAARGEGALCDDGDVCTLLDQCIAGGCIGSGALVCNDGDPCTVDACLPAAGCDSDPITGFPSVACVFERDTITAGCPSGLPRPIRTRLERARRLVMAGSLTDRARKARRTLAGARRALKQAARLAAARGRRGSIEAGCAAALEQALGDMVVRTEALRALVP